MLIALLKRKVSTGLKICLSVFLNIFAVMFPTQTVAEVITLRKNVNSDNMKQS